MSSDSSNLTPGRSVPMEVLVLGLSRTGTSSLMSALQTLGYHDVHHMSVVFNASKEENAIWVRAFEHKYGGIGKPLERRDWDEATGKYMALSDEPAASFPEELMTVYPEAKVILTVRDNSKVWAKSFDETIWERLKIVLVLTNIPILDFIRFNMLPGPKNFEVIKAWAKYRPCGKWQLANGPKIYEEHNENIRRLARKYDRPLLEFNSKQGWGPLCQFLGKEITPVPFPHAWDRKAFSRETNFIRAVRYLAFIGEVLIVAVGLWFVTKLQRVQIFLAYRDKKWSFLVGIFGGLALGVAGYVGQILIYDSPFVKNPFLLYLICLTIDPAFLCASAYLRLCWLIIVYSESLSRVKLRTCTIILVCCDLISLVLQVISGALGSSTDNGDQLNTGTHIMVAGFSFHVFSLLLFMCLAGEFTLRVLSSNRQFNPTYTELRRKTSFKMFLYALSFATLYIFVRGCFLVGELGKRFGGLIFRNDEVTFVVLERAMIGAAVLVLTIIHQGFAFKVIWGSVSQGTRGEAGREEGVDIDEVTIERKK